MGENVNMKAYARETLLEDESAFLQLGQTSESKFYDFTLSTSQLTSWNKFPSKMKYADVEIFLDHNKTIWSRQTYSLLDFLGDLGGLFDALKFIIASILGPFSGLALKFSIFSGVFTCLKQQMPQETV